MTDLPSGWSLCEIGEVLQPVEKTGKQEQDREIWYVDISSIDSKSNRITAPKRLTLSKAPSRARQKIRSGDVLFSTVRPYLRNIAPVDRRFDGEIASTGFAVLRGAKGINPRYLLYKCISHDFVSALTGEQYGVSYPAIKAEQVKTQPIELPPTNEQRRIVEKIESLFDEIDRGVESLLAAKATLELYRKSLLKAAFDGRLTGDWRARNPDKLESPETLINRIRKERESRYQVALVEWEKSLAEWQTNGEEGKKPAKPKRPAVFKLLDESSCTPWPIAQVRALIGAPLVNGRSVKGEVGGFPVLRLTAIKNGKIDCAEHKEGNWTQEDARPFLVGHEDILLARGNGSKRLVGIAGRVLGNIKPVAFPDTMIRVQIDRSVVRPDFFILIWNSQTVRQQIELTARTTAGIYKINQQHVQGFALPLPCLKEQAEIVRLLDISLEATAYLETEIEGALLRVDLLRQSILKRAFAGQLVPQDPADQPAKALLETLKAARTKSKRNTRKRIATT